MHNNDSQETKPELNFISVDNAIKTWDKLYSCSQGQKLITELYERGIKLMENQKFESAAQVFQESLEISPKHLIKFFKNLKAFALHNSGVDLFSQNKFEEALKLYNEVQASVSDDFLELTTLRHNIDHTIAELENKKGEELAAEKKFFEAIEKFQEAFKVCPKKVKTRGRFKRSIANCAFKLWLSNKMDSKKTLSTLEEAFIFTPDDADRKKIRELQAFILNIEGNELQYQKKFLEAAAKYDKAWDYTSDVWNQKYLKQLKKNAISRQGKRVSTSEFVDELIQQNEEMMNRFLAEKMDLNDLMSYSQKTFNIFEAAFGTVLKLIGALFMLFIEILQFLIKMMRCEEANEVIATARIIFPEESANLEKIEKEINSALNRGDHNITTNLSNIKDGNFYYTFNTVTKKEETSHGKFLMFWLTLLLAVFLAIYQKYYT